MKAAQYLVRVERIEQATIWRGRKRVHWTAMRTVARFDEFLVARAAARTLLRNRDPNTGFMIVRIAVRGRTIWVGDAFKHEEYSKIEHERAVGRAAVMSIEESVQP